MDEADAYFAIHKNQENSFSHFVDYLTKMIERYEEALKKQDLSPLCPKAKLVHRVELSSSLFPDKLPKIPQSFKKEVKAIFETMSC